MANEKKKNDKSNLLDRFFNFLKLYAKSPTAIDMAIARGKADMVIRKVEKMYSRQAKIEEEWKEIEHLEDLMSVTELYTPEYYQYERRLQRLLR